MNEFLIRYRSVRKSGRKNQNFRPLSSTAVFSFLSPSLPFFVSSSTFALIPRFCNVGIDGIHCAILQVLPCLLRC